MAEEKAESIWGIQEKSLGVPLRASVRGVEKQDNTRAELPVEINNA